ncbi:MAG: ammonium transporter [Verrucomicrobiota bacterium]
MENPIDIFWILICAALVFLMQGGFLCLESGLTRTKNNINVALKNLADLGVSTIILWGVSFGLIFGSSAGGFIGANNFFPAFKSTDHFAISFFIYQALFCGTAVTILSGATAERMFFRSYIICAMIISGFVYPVCAHAIWNGGLTGEVNGWLGKLGFVDFAGSTAVHSVGGWVSLAILLIIGPRTGMFKKNRQTMNGSNMPLAMVGVILLWFGWFGFNGGSYFAFDSGVPAVLLNTLLGGAGGVVTACILSQIRNGHINVLDAMTGCIAGLVGVTAGAHCFNSGAALICGIVGAAIAFGCGILLHKLEIDDAVEAIPAHLAAGIWGTLAVALFGDMDIIGATSRFDQLGIQVVGVLYTGAVAFGATTIIARLINRFIPLRVDPSSEHQGLNISEHDAHTDWHDLFVGMTEHSNLKDLSKRIPEEPFTEAGMVANLYNNVMDVLETTVNHNHTVISTAMDGIITFDSQTMKITSVNPAAEIILSEDSDALIGTKLNRHFRSSILQEGKANDIHDIVSDLAREGSITDLWAKRYNGEELPIEMAFTAAESSKQDFYVGIFRDMSQRYEAERRLAQAQEMEEANRAKSLFLANMSHELRTPLNQIIGYSEILEEEIVEIDGSETMMEELSTINQAGHHLLTMIDDLLDVSNIESGSIELNMEQFDLQEIIEEAIAATQGESEANHNKVIRRWESDSLDIIKSDKGKLRQILTCLCSNAAKFTENGLIEISAARFYDEQRKQELIHLRVSDTGIGMSEEQLGEVFDSFTQGSSGYTKEYGGTGIGLTLVQAFTQRLGGWVTVQSEAGVGSAFNIFLPANRDAGRLEAPEIHFMESSNRVLVIDEHADSHNIIARALRDEDCSIKGVNRADSAFTTIQDKAPSLIFINGESGSAGEEFVKKLGKTPELQSIPLVFIGDDGHKDTDLYLHSPLAESEIRAAFQDNINSQATRGQRGSAHTGTAELSR